MAYTVGEMARRLGVPASTIRYYDKEGLLPFVGRSSGGIRVFYGEGLRMAAHHRVPEKDRHVPQGHPRIHRAGHAGR